jgi:hypothetical protein
MNIQTLTKEEIKKSAPAVYATQPKASMTERYSFVQTDKIIEGFNQAGWDVTKAFQSKTKKDDPNVRKHVVRLSNPEFQPVMKEVGSLTPEIILINSHNGSSSIRMEIGLFRLVCSNGLIIADSHFAQVKRRHFGVDQDEIFQVIYDATKEFNDVWGKVDEYRSIKLTNGQRLDFASKVIEQNWGSDSVITPDALLIPRRIEDKSDDLFSTYNVIQENVIKGGANYIHPHRNTLRKTRAIKNADRDIRINAMLWQFIENFRLNRKFSL